MYEQQRQELAEICHKLYERNLVTATDGNVSMRVSHSHILLTPSGRNKGDVGDEEMLVLNFDGTIVEGNGKASKEYPMHRAVYETRSDVNAVIHTHPIFATAFALTGQNIPDNYLVETSMMLKGVSLVSYAMPGSHELAEAVREAVRSKNAVLLLNHGALTAGKDLASAFNTMEVLEAVAKTIIVSRILGDPVLISEEDLNRMRGN